MVLKRPKAASPKSRQCTIPLHGVLLWHAAVHRNEPHQATRLAVIQLTMFGSHEPAL
jgi:hypothetical protein